MKKIDTHVTVKDSVYIIGLVFRTSLLFQVWDFLKRPQMIDFVSCPESKLPLAFLSIQLHIKIKKINTWCSFMVTGFMIPVYKLLRRIILLSTKSSMSNPAKIMQNGSFFHRSPYYAHTNPIYNVTIASLNIKIELNTRHPRQCFQRCVPELKWGFPHTARLINSPKWST